MYFYCLGIVPALTNIKEDLFVSSPQPFEMLRAHLEEFYLGQNYLHLTSPLLLTLRALL